ncbi:MAG: hypothetical protein QM270_08315, partial [Bacillota bacterium]|nr:hypothetical protein [Bacillota bacterium]
EDALRRFLSFLRFVEKESGSLDVDLSQPSHFHVEAEFYADVHGQSPGRLRGLRGSGRPRRFRRSEPKSLAVEADFRVADEEITPEQMDEILPRSLLARLREGWRSRRRLYLLVIGCVVLCLIIAILVWLF